MPASERAPQPTKCWRVPKQTARLSPAPANSRHGSREASTSSLERARAFYEALGWVTGAEPGDTSFSSRRRDDHGTVERRETALRLGCRRRRRLGGVTLAHNVHSPAEVDAVIDEARRAGA